jgi:hypothetical protein
MSTEILLKAFTVSVDGETTNELENEILPRGSYLRWVTVDATEGDQVIVLGLAGEVEYHAIAPATQYAETFVTNHDIRGIVVDTLDSGILYIMKPSGAIH